MATTTAAAPAFDMLALINAESYECECCSDWTLEPLVTSTLSSSRGGITRQVCEMCARVDALSNAR